MPSLVIAVGQIKGGVGKTTIAINLAGQVARRGLSVCIIDCDPQGSALQWGASHQLPFDVRQELISLRSTAIWVRNVLKSGTEVIIIDLPSGHGLAFDMAVTISDRLIIPCGPSSMDISSAQMTIQKARDLARLDSTIRPQLVLAPTRVDISVEEGQQLVEELEGLGEPVTPALSYDSSYVRSFSKGMTVDDFAPNSLADREMSALAEFVLNTCADHTALRDGSRRRPGPAS